VRISVRATSVIGFVTLSICLSLLSSTPTAVASAQTQSTVAPEVASRQKCRSGYVSLTFDDGPSATVTPQLVKILLRKKVPATFFMVGERVASAPSTAKLVASSGFRIANHSYGHEDLTTLTRREIRKTLRTTKRALRAADVRKPIKLMRPPYGAINRRVKRTIRRAGYVPVLWNADSLDWSGGSVRTITKRVLQALSPGGSIVLQHDGINNSPNSVAAVPGIIKKARARGYCFTGLNAKGRLIVPAPRVSLTALDGREGHRASVRVKLSHPVPMPTSVLLSTEEGRYSNAATSGTDYQRRSQRVIIPAGATATTVQFALPKDDLDEPTEVFFAQLSSPADVLLGRSSVRVRIQDASRPPGIAIYSTEVIEPQGESTTAQVRIRLGRPSGYDVHLTVVSTPASADETDFLAESLRVTIPAGRTSASVPILVRADDDDEEPESFGLMLTSATNATIFRGRARVTILDAPTRTDITP
jgi:peptidoglycan-N-acetylglucosamine deacetylase